MANEDKRRPEPEELLRLAQREEAAGKRGKLTIYLGAAPGVGKTFAMLGDGRQRQNEGLDVVVGYAETHGRRETDELLEGLEQLPPMNIAYRGFELRDFNLEAAIKRKPQLILIDELAHTNAPGMRHAKRFQDVEELLDAGIDVYSTINIQHLESLNDVINQIIGIKVRETVPDTVIDRAEEIKLIDLPPEQLIKRLHEGKVYVKDIVGIAVEKYFRPGNLLALRELALRVVAGTVDEKMRQYMREYAIAGIWPTRERVLAAVFASPYAEKLVRSAYRLASELDGELIAFHVETERNPQFSEQERAWLDKALNLANRLGARVVWIKGADVASEIADYAQRNNITKIVIGKPRRHRFRVTLSSDILTKTPNIDVYMMDSGTAAQGIVFPAERRRRFTSAISYLLSLAMVGAVLFVSVLLRDVLNQVDLLFLLLLPPIIAALYFGRGPSIVASLVGIAAFDYMLVPPYNSFNVSDLKYFFSFFIYFGAVVLISNLAIQRRKDIRLLRQSESKSVALYGLSRDLIASRNLDQALLILVRHTSQLVQSEVAVFLPREGVVELRAQSGAFDVDEKEMAVAAWTYTHRQMAGLGTSTLPEAKALYVPMMSGQRIVGVMGVRGEVDLLANPEQQVALETSASLGAMALEQVAHLAEEAGARTSAGQEA